MEHKRFADFLSAGLFNMPFSISNILTGIFCVRVEKIRETLVQKKVVRFMLIQEIGKRIKFRKLLNNAEQDTARQSSKDSRPPKKIDSSLRKNIEDVKQTLGDSNDVKIREFTIGTEKPVNAALVFIDGLINNDIITECIMKPLLLYRVQTSGNVIEGIKKHIICTGDVTEDCLESKLLAACLAGDTILLVDGCSRGLIISSKGWDKRSVTEPQTESVARGPREGFTENFRTNTSLLRRKIRNPALRMETFTIGEKTRTIVSVMYLKGVADQSLIEEIKRRLSSIKVDAILESGYIEQYIEDSPFSVFPSIGKSEKPDTIAAKILEGRAAIIVDGTPFVLTAPMLFTESFQTAEDYYVRTFYASVIRFLRFCCFLVAVLGPAFLIAITTFHQELLPAKLMFTIAAAREGTPFLTVIEAILLLFAFEILREAGLRLPRPMGQAVSIVGALVMGDAAVSAGLVGAPMVVTIAISAMAEFVTPDYEEAITLLRFIFIILASIFGLYGMLLGVLVTLINLASMESFGVPYFSGVAPARKQNMGDLFIRVPLWKMTKRPSEFAHQDVTRQKSVRPPENVPNTKQGDGKP